MAKYAAARHRTPQSRLLRQHRSRQHRLRLQPRQQPEQHSRQRSHRQPSLLSPRSRQQRFPRVWLAYAKEFVKNPVEASEAVVGEHSITTVAGLVVVNAALQLIYSLISIIVHTAKGWHYDIADWVMAIVRPVLWWVAIPAAFAGLIWVCAKYVEGTNVSFKKALSVFAIPALPMLVFTLINLLGLVLTHSFFSVIFGVIHAAVTGIMFYLTGIGIVKVLPLSKKFIYSIAIICAGLYFVNWLVTRAIF